MLLRRSMPVLITGILTFFFLTSLFRSRSISIRRPLQVVGLGREHGPAAEQIASGENILPDLRTAKPTSMADLKPDFAAFYKHKIEDTSPFPKGVTKPAGSNYTKTLVIARLNIESTSWVEKELGDLIEDNLLQTAIYVVDDRLAPLHPPQNKGHEVMVYLSYIIDNYYNLPDVSIFMHAHRYSWHNNELLNGDASLMVRHLSPERVTREGYMNLRCHWEPGCPDWLHPGTEFNDPEKSEEVLIAESWSQLFPSDPMPTVLAQPCCAQFAVSRERILETPRTRFLAMRDWLFKTDLSDYLSGRIFEYAWQFIFNHAPIHCPDSAACYCDGYGICFDDPMKFVEWFDLKFEIFEVKEELSMGQEQAGSIDAWMGREKDGTMAEEAALLVPGLRKSAKLRQRLREIEMELRSRQRKAMELGMDPRQRAKESGREWKEGDGF